MPKRAKKEKRPVEKIDFMPYGAAIKVGRTKQKESRNKAADALFISPRYLANIENNGQHPSVQIFLEMMSRYHISVDQMHLWSRLGDVVRKIDNLVVPIVHVYCASPFHVTGDL